MIIFQKTFWMKLLKEFSDDFVLIEAEPHHVANIIWTYGRIGNKYLSQHCDPMEDQWIIEQFNKLLTFIQDRLDQCDGQTLSILLWAVSCSNYKSLQICRKHSIFDGNNSKSIGSRILQLIETDDCYIIPNIDVRMYPIICIHRDMDKVKHTEYLYMISL